MAGSFTPVKTPNTRVFLIEGRARGDHAPSYVSGMRMMGVAQGFGDVERIENPDRRVESRLGRDDRTSHGTAPDHGIEIAAASNVGNRVGVSPKRDRALHQRRQLDRPGQRLLPSRATEHG